MTLEEEIAEAQSCIADPPKNESNTCEWIILPLLWAAGYARRDIESRMADNGGKFPDYTLLSSTPATWYLEAKAWNVALENNHAQQALNYANHNGKRFVVLTNGQNWRLYDNAIQGLPVDKLITRASVEDTEAFRVFIVALSKTEALSGGLERYVEALIERNKQEALERREKERQAELLSCLQSTLPGQLSDAESGITELITLYLSEKEEFQGINAATVAGWFNEAFSPTPQSREKRKINPVTQQPLSPIVSDNTRTLNLREMQENTKIATSTKPVLLHLPGGTTVGIGKWVNFAEQAVICLSQQSHTLPIPFDAGSPTLWFLNLEPKHKRGTEFRGCRKIVYNGKTLYINTHYSARELLKAIHALCLAVGVPPEGFRITFRA